MVLEQFPILIQLGASKFRNLYIPHVIACYQDKDYNFRNLVTREIIVKCTDKKKSKFANVGNYTSIILDITYIKTLMIDINY